MMERVMMEKFREISNEIEKYFEELWKTHELNKYTKPSIHGIKVQLYRALMEESEYKTGDRVKLIKQVALNIPTGLEGIIIDIDNRNYRKKAGVRA